MSQWAHALALTVVDFPSPTDDCNSSQATKFQVKMPTFCSATAHDAVTRTGALNCTVLAVVAFYIITCTQNEMHAENNCGFNFWCIQSRSVLT